MKTNKIIGGFLILLAATVASAQDTAGVAKKSYDQRQMNLPKQQINQLHDGALLVRLSTRKNAVDALRKNGQDEQANLIEKRQSGINKEIIKAFRSNFDFCKVYFFYSDDSKEVMEKRFNNVKFLNENLSTDASVAFAGNNFLTAEFGAVEQDTSKYFEDYRSVSDESGPKKETAYYGGSNIDFNALVIKSDQFIQLRKPFPYYVKANGAPEDVKKTNKVVKKMNKQLHEFYKQMKA